jgi:1,3-beta-glucanosyltransferase GAS4
VQPRTFQEVTAIFSDQMTGVFSGGLAYEFTEEPNNYGLVDINGTTATILNDYVALQARYRGWTVSEGPVTRVIRAAACPPATNFANINGTQDLPDIPAADLIMNGIDPSLYWSGQLITPSDWSTSYMIIDQNGKIITNKAINSKGYLLSNPTNNGAEQSGNKIGKGRDNSATSGARQLRFHVTLIGAVGLGLAAWNGLA